MREIKFRAWDKDNFEMFTYDNIGDVIFGLENNGTVSLFICDSEESPNVDIMQFTGLTDKNGVDIYEGDVMKWDAKEWGCPFSEVVEWSFELLEIRRLDWSEWCEVIGNIHQNPELTAVESGNG